MRRSIATTLFLVLAAAAAGFAWGRRGVQPATTNLPTGEVAAHTSRIPAPELAAPRRTAGDQIGLAGRVRALERRLAGEAARRRELEGELAHLRDTVAALGASGGEGAGDARTADGGAGAASDGAPAHEPPQGGPRARATDSGRSPMQRALAAAGVDSATAEGIKRRGDELALDEMYLRDQATREGWLDTPRFAEELASIEEQRTSVRDEIGDDAYDRYLFALGHPNRVRVQDVMAGSVAEEVGLRAGDMILRYGDTRIFHSDDLVEQTRDGEAGEPVRVQVLRDGERLEIDVPRGPLGLRIGAALNSPDAR